MFVKFSQVTQVQSNLLKYGVIPLCHIYLQISIFVKFQINFLINQPNHVFIYIYLSVMSEHNLHNVSIFKHSSHKFRSNNSCINVQW